MLFRKITFVAALLVAGITPMRAEDSVATWTQNLSAWRAQHEAEFRDADGWLSVVGLKWLNPGLNTVGAAADNQQRIEDLGAEHLLSLRYQDERVIVEAPSAGFPAGLSVDGKAAQAGAVLQDGAQASQIRYGSFTLFLIHRGDRLGLRIKNAHAESLRNFGGLRWYAPNPAYRVLARWIPYDQPRTVTVHNVVNTASEGILAGEVQFELDGKTITLLPVLQSLNDHVLFFVLRDATSKTTTYQASRFLHASLPDHGLRLPGTVELDFNRLVNPPCAFTPFATCPLPIEQNKLAVALPVGELRYKDE